MKPIDFKGVNIIFGANQSEYQPLPAMKMPDGDVYTCWELTTEEAIEIATNKRIFLSQKTFNQPLQPILPMANLEDNLFLKL